LLTPGSQDPGFKDEAARVRLGAAAGTPADILLKLALDPSVMVRTALAVNPATPPTILGVLARDADERVRALLASRLAALAPGLSEGEQSRLNKQTIEALEHLVEDTAVRVRAAIAEVVKEMPDAPRELVLRLARDTSLQVSEPVIRLSPMLTQADLLSLLAAACSPEIALAVARRPGLTADVSDVLADTADSTAIRAMLLNQSAQIRESTLDALIARAVEHGTWHAPLVRRPSLSPRAAEALSLIVADALLAELASRADLAPSVIADLRARLNARLGQHVEAQSSAADLPKAISIPSAGPIGGPAGGRISVEALTPAAAPASAEVPTRTTGPNRMVVPDRTEPSNWTAAPFRTAAPKSTEAWIRARALAASGRLTEAELLDVAGRGEVRLASAMLAVAADVPVSLVEHAATLRSAKGILSLVWKAGFSMRLAVPLQSLLARLAPGALLIPGPRGTFPLAVEEMRWQIQFLRQGSR
jgi:uncharacterized protein (DUF2336 family)